MEPCNADTSRYTPCVILSDENGEPRVVIELGGEARNMGCLAPVIVSLEPKVGGKRLRQEAL